jgi:hypothetical protein
LGLPLEVCQQDWTIACDWPSQQCLKPAAGSNIGSRKLLLLLPASCVSQVVAEDGEVSRRQQSDVDGEQGTIVFCIPAHTMPAATPQHEGQQQHKAEQQQQPQPTESHSEIAAAAAAAAFPGAGTPTSKGRGKRKAAAQPAQPRAKQRKASQQQQQGEAAAAKQQQEHHAAAEDHSEGMPAAAAEAEGAAEADGEGAAAAPQSQAAAGSKKQQPQQQKTPKKQPQAARHKKSTATAAAAAAGGAGDAEGGAEQQQDPAAKLQDCLQRLHDAASLLRTSLQQQQGVLQDIAALGLTPQAARKFAAKAASSSSSCKEVLDMIKAPAQPGKQQQYSSMLPGCSALLQEVRKLGTSKVLPLFCDVKAASGSQQQQRPQQQQQQQGMARPAAQQQQQQQRQRAPGAAGKALPVHGKQQQQERRSSGGGVGGQHGISSHDQQQNGKAAASRDDLRVFLRTCAELVPLKPLHSQPRDKTVALLSAVLQPPQAVSPFALAQELEALLHAKYGSSSSSQQQQQGAKAPSQAYMRHLQVLWDMLGGADLQEADMADKAAQEAAAEAAAAVAAAEAEGAADDESLQQARAEAEARAEAAAAEAARAQGVFEGVSGEAGGASLRRALLEGRLSAREVFDATMPRASTTSKPSM